MIPTLADLEAYRFFGYNGRQLDAMRIDKSLGPVSWAEVRPPSSHLVPLATYASDHSLSAIDQHAQYHPDQLLTFTSDHHPSDATGSDPLP